MSFWINHIVDKIFFSILCRLDAHVIEDTEKTNMMEISLSRIVTGQLVCLDEINQAQQITRVDQRKECALTVDLCASSV